MPIVQEGLFNVLGSRVPNWVVQIISPKAAPVVGIQSNVLAMVGTASWGPVNALGYGGGIADYKAQYGAVNPVKFDMGAPTVMAGFQGCSMFIWSRVTDGTDLASTGTITAASAADATAIAAAINLGQSGLRAPSSLVKATAAAAIVTIVSYYTGSFGNKTRITIGAGSKPLTTRVTVSVPGYNPELYDNIGSAVATVATATLTGGTDGASGVTTAMLLGTDGAIRTGMYSLRKSSASVAMLTDCDDSTTWPAQSAFGLAEGISMIATTPQGDSIGNAITAKNTAGIDSYSIKIMMGDWLQYNDVDNGQIRLVSPQAAVAGARAALSPHLSLLNYKLNGIVNTQRGLTGRPYSDSELLQLVDAGIDVISNPSVGGNFFSCRIGHNSSSNILTKSDTYTALTNFIARSLVQWAGYWVGKLQTKEQRLAAKAGAESFFSNMELQGMIGNVNGGKAYSVQIDAFNNPISQVSIGIEQCDIKVMYLSVIETFLANVEGSQATIIASGAPARQ